MHVSLEVLTFPGWGSSDSEHWQTQWEQHYGYRRIVPGSWDEPDRADWLHTLECAVAAAGPNVVLAAHSLACLAVAHWAGATSLRVAGALLVAPPDADRPDFPAVLRGFGPMPRRRLPFPTMVVGSTTDEYISLERARQLAQDWGSRFVNMGPHGHLNSASGLGLWPEGHALLQTLTNPAPS
ncbi:alpha/beta hydrolase [Hymenobacter sp. CRA2]|nr:alpha/beta hydrolase [Hymenobacter sp. CRA2]